MPALAGTDLARGDVEMPAERPAQVRQHHAQVRAGQALDGASFEGDGRHLSVVTPFPRVGSLRAPLRGACSQCGGAP